jgi:hypothetical protein
VTGVAAVAIFAAPTVTNASAASGGAACSVTGASGSLTFTNWWHSDYDGNGSTLSFTTYASPTADHLDYIGAEVAVIEGSTVVRSCTDYA